MVDFSVSDAVLCDAGDITAITNAIQGIPNTSKVSIVPSANGLQVIVFGYE